MLSSLAQDGHAMECLPVSRSPLVLGVWDLALADLVLTVLDRAPPGLAPALAVMDLVLAVFDPGLYQVYPTLPSSSAKRTA